MYAKLYCMSSAILNLWLEVAAHCQGNSCCSSSITLRCTSSGPCPGTRLQYSIRLESLSLMDFKEREPDL